MPEPRDEAWTFIHKLFAPEVPEIASGVVEIRAVARIPGVRTKVAVYSLDPQVDGVGVCLGERNRAIDAVAARLGKERLDLIPWSDSPERLVSLALAPARVERVVLDHGQHKALVTVAKDQVAVAVGREGQNAELASRLSGWTISIEIKKDAA